MSNVSWLTNTSVQDLQSSLSCAEANDELNIDVLREAYRLVTRRGEFTKAKLLDRYIRKLIKLANQTEEVNP